MFDLVLLVRSGVDYSHIKNVYPLMKVVEYDGVMNREVMRAVLNKTFTRFFYVLTDPSAEYDIGDFTPDQWDSSYVHIWEDDTRLALYNRRAVTTNIDTYIDDVPFKSNAGKRVTSPDYDVVFLSYDEECADKNYSDLLKICPRAKRVSGVKGIFNAHQAASFIATTPMFFVVDGDATDVVQSVFATRVSQWDASYAHIWRAKNPLNNLVYGYGGVKLFPTGIIRAATTWNLDFTTTVTSGVKIIDEVSNVTGFNHSPLSSWRSAFRECVKLSSATSDNSQYLNEWLSSSGNYSEYARKGAKMGIEYGKQHTGDTEALSKINDYQWLGEMFSDQL